MSHFVSNFLIVHEQVKRWKACFSFPLVHKQKSTTRLPYHQKLFHGPRKQATFRSYGIHRWFGAAFDLLILSTVVILFIETDKVSKQKSRFKFQNIFTLLVYNEDTFVRFYHFCCLFLLFTFWLNAVHVLRRNWRQSSDNAVWKLIH